MPAWHLTHAQYEADLAPASRSGCGGTFLVDEDSGKGPVITRCDGCGQLLGVGRKVFEVGVPAPVTEQLSTGEAF